MTTLYYLDLGPETIEISKQTYKELWDKGYESFSLEEGTKEQMINDGKEFHYIKLIPIGLNNK